MARFFRFLAVIIFLLTSSVMLVAQPRNFKMTAKGIIVDSKTQEPLFAATVKVTSADGGTGTFGITDTIGQFSFEINRPGKYTLDFSFVGYKSFTKEVNIWPGRGTNLGTFKMEEDPTYLKEVETVARNQRVKQVGDTIVYNADAYKVQDGASAEDLVSKMPGIEVTETGVKAQGETVEKILVDGKSFFENDPKLALKTLPAEVVQSVQVFDKKSDQAEFTGFDDGNTVKAMDLKTKSYRRNGMFGKVYGSLGDNFNLDHLYWNAGFNLNIFSGNRRVSMLGMSNNVNQQNFTFDDLQSTGGMGGRGGRMAMRMGNQPGVSRANAFGLNFNDSYLNDKLELQGSYFFNGTRTTYENETQTDAIRTNRATISQTNRLSHNFSHRLDMRISYKPSEKDQFIFRPSLNIQKSDSRSLGESHSWQNPLDSILALTDAMRQDKSKMFAYERNVSSTESTTWNAGGHLTWRHKFDKTGRTLSSEVRGSVSGSESENHYIRTGSSVDAGTNFQNITNDQNNWSASGNLQYTEPLGETSQLSVRYNLSYNKSDRDNNTGYNKNGYGAVDYYQNDYRMVNDTLDAANSNKYISKNLRQGGELAYRFHTEAINLMAGINFESSMLDGEQNYFAWNEAIMGQSPNYVTSKTYFSVLPNMRFEWRPWEGGSLNIDYRANTNNPSISNLQQSINTSRSLNYSTGNKNLDQSTSHNLSVRFIHSNMEMATNIMFYANVSMQQDNIGTQYISNETKMDLPLKDLGWVRDLDAKDKEQFENLVLKSGGRITRPINMDGSRSARAGLAYGFPFDLLRSNVNVSMNTSYAVNPSMQMYVRTDANDATKYFEDDMTSKVRDFSLSPRLHITSNISQDLDFSLSYSPSFQKVKDTENKQNNYEYFNQSADARLNWTFWKNFTMEQQVSYRYFGGKSIPSVEDEWVWNMSFGKKFLKKNAAEIKLQIYDVLNTRTGYSRSVGIDSNSYSYTNYMPRYFMLTFSYKIANYKGASQIKERQGGGRGGRGGFGGPGGFGGF